MYWVFLKIRCCEYGVSIPLFVKYLLNCTIRKRPAGKILCPRPGEDTIFPSALSPGSRTVPGVGQNPSIPFAEWVMY